MTEPRGREARDEGRAAMTGETDLETLLRSMSPRLRPDTYVWATVDSIPAGCRPFATVAEDESITVVLDRPQAERLGLEATFDSACLTLEVHSALEAVGLTAAVARALGDAGISCNVVAGFHHDHLFVPWERRDDAMATLAELAARTRAE